MFHVAPAAAAAAARAPPPEAIVTANPPPLGFQTVMPPTEIPRTSRRST
jgi:hypothetical protein